MDVREKALVTAHYDGIAGVMKWGALPEAEAEVENLAAFLAPDVADRAARPARRPEAAGRYAPG